MGNRIVVLSESREALATLVKDSLATDIAVVDHLPDSVAVPCVILAWGDPWIKPSTLCAYEARMELLVVAQRIEPGGKLKTLEDIVSALLVAIKPVQSFAVDDVTSPYPFQMGGVDYLATSINIIHDLEG